MSTYAAKTEVSADRSRTEIEKTLQRYGATSFVYGWEETRAAVGFVAHGRQVRLVIPLPDPSDREFARTPTGRPRSAVQAKQAYEQAVRARWRSLALVVKAKLEAVATGLVTFEQEFLAYTVLPNGQTLGEWVEPQIDQVYATGQAPSMLPGVPPALGGSAEDT